MSIIKATARDSKANPKQLRREDIVPCVISGSGLSNSILIQIDNNTAKILKSTMRDGSLADIDLNGKIYHTLIKSIDYSYIKDSVEHIAFQVLDGDKKFNSVADVVLINKDKLQGVLEQIQMRIPHAATPEFLLDTVTVDLANIPVGSTLTVGDIPEFMSDNIELQADPNSIVLRVSYKKQA